MQSGLPRRLAVLALPALLAAAVLGGCGPTVATSSSPSASGVAVELEVTTDRGAEFLYMPDELHAPARTSVRLTFRNVSTESHNLTFGAPIGTATQTIVESGESDVVDLVTPGPGRYAFVCTIHMDMTGTLVVD